MSVTPRPEFGRPETGSVAYWERQGWSRYTRPPRPARHLHSLCYDCSAGLHDVGILAGSPRSQELMDRDERPCCTCLRPMKPGKSTAGRWGPNARAFVCRVERPDAESVEMAAS